MVPWGNKKKSLMAKLKAKRNVVSWWWMQAHKTVYYRNVWKSACKSKFQPYKAV